MKTLIIILLAGIAATVRADGPRVGEFPADYRARQQLEAAIKAGAITPAELIVIQQQAEALRLQRAILNEQGLLLIGDRLIRLRP